MSVLSGAVVHVVVSVLVGLRGPPVTRMPRWKLLRVRMTASGDGVSGERVHPLGPWGKGPRWGDRFGSGPCRAGRELARVGRAECARPASVVSFERNRGWSAQTAVRRSLLSRRPTGFIRKDLVGAHRVSSEVVPWDRRVQQLDWFHSPVRNRARSRRPQYDSIQQQPF